MNGPPAPRQLTFRNLSRVASVICVLLACVWILAPRVLLSLWQVESPVSTLLVARRVGALFLGLGIMLWLARDAESSPAREAMAVGFAVGCAALAALGICEFAAGRAGPGIWLAIAVEVPLAVGFVIVRRAAK